MNIKLIKTEADYQKALKRLEEIFDAKIGSNESDEIHDYYNTSNQNI